MTGLQVAVVSQCLINVLFHPLCRFSQTHRMKLLDNPTTFSVPVFHDIEDFAYLLLKCLKAHIAI